MTQVVESLSPTRETRVEFKLLALSKLNVGYHGYLGSESADRISPLSAHMLSHTLPFPVCLYLANKTNVKWRKRYNRLQV